MREELHLLIATLSDRQLKICTPITQLVRHNPSARSWSDSYLVASRALVYVKNNKNSTLVSIDVFKYAALLINYAVAYHCFHHNPNPPNPFPMVLLDGDNAALELWTEEACNSSLLGRILSCLQCVMMINNNMGVSTEHISTTNNVIADCNSCIKS